MKPQSRRIVQRVMVQQLSSPVQAAPQPVLFVINCPFTKERISAAEKQYAAASISLEHPAVRTSRHDTPEGLPMVPLMLPTLELPPVMLALRALDLPLVPPPPPSSSSSSSSTVLTTSSPSRNTTTTLSPIELLDAELAIVDEKIKCLQANDVRLVSESKKITRLIADAPRA